ncbi:MAG: EAL domain-containing protein [Lysinibacillus sp.]
MQQSAIKNEQLLRSIKTLAENAKKSYVILDMTKESKIINCNEPFEKLVNYTYEQLKQMDYYSLFTSETLTEAIDDIKEKLQQGIMVRAKVHHDCYQRPPFWAEIEGLPFQDEDNQTVYVLLFIKDVTYYHIEDFLMRLEKEMYMAIEKENTFEKKMNIICKGLDEFFAPYIFSMILVKNNKDTLKVYTGPTFEYEIEPETKLNDYYKTIMRADKYVLEENIAHLNICDSSKRKAQELGKQSCWYIPIRNQQNRSIGIFAIYYSPYESNEALFVNVFNKIGSLVSLAYSYAKTQNKIYELAYTDITTGLPNRHSFIEALEKIEKQGKRGYIKILEPSEFRQIVELYGREAGDELLRQISRRFIENKNEKNEHIARFTSSCLIISRVISHQDMMNYESRIKELIQQPFLIGDKQVYITLKTGIASFNDEIKMVDAIRFAETALSYANNKPGTHTEIFTEERNKELEKQMLLLNHLNIALKNKEISVHLQPKVDLRTGAIQSIEALARWISPTLGYVSPAEFVPVAENAGKVREIDLQVLEQVLQWIQMRQQEGKELVKMAVNISPNHFYHPDFVTDLVTMLNSYSVEPNNIILEVTESIGLFDFHKALMIIEELRAYGFVTSVDDFGMGFSSLSYLQKLPFSEIKIDRSFINDLYDAGTLAIVRSIIQLALNLGIESVAEGIETEEQADILRALGCSVGQGFLYYKPMPFEQVSQILDA